jgi:hypothetical protein
MFGVRVMKSKWIEHQGRRILYMDLSGFKENLIAFEAELNEAVTTVGQEMYQQPLNSVLVLVDLRNTTMTQKVQTMLSDRITDTRKYVLRTAVIGMTGIRRVFLDFFSRLAASDTGSFDEPEAGKNWLVKSK